MRKKNTMPVNHNFGQALEEAIRKKFKNQIKFAEAIGVTQATVSRYISGVAMPSFQMLEKISEVLQIDLPMINSSYKPSIDNSMIKLPMYYSEVSAGHGLMSLDTSYDYLHFDAQWLKNQFLINNLNGIFAVRVKGDSMEPIIQEGDIVFAKKFEEDTTTSQGIYIVNYNDDYLIKKVQFKSKELVKLISSNLDYDPIEINLKDPAESFNFKIIAKVVGRINTKSFARV